MNTHSAPVSAFSIAKQAGMPKGLYFEETGEETVDAPPADDKVTRTINGQQVKLTKEEDQALLDLGYQKWLETQDKGKEPEEKKTKEKDTSEVNTLTKSEAENMIQSALNKNKNDNLVKDVQKSIKTLDAPDRIKSKVQKLLVVDLMNDPDLDIDSALKDHLKDFKTEDDKNYVEKKKETAKQTKTPRKGDSPGQEEPQREPKNLKKGDTKKRAAARMTAARKDF